MTNDFEKPLTPDEQAVTDYLSGALKKLPPSVAPASEDRARLEELMELRNNVAAAEIAAPEMTTTFNDVVRRAAQRGAAAPILDWMSSRWGLRLTAAAAVFIVFVAGTVAVSPNMFGRYSTGMAPSAESASLGDIKNQRHGGDRTTGTDFYNDIWYPDPKAGDTSTLKNGVTLETGGMKGWTTTATAGAADGGNIRWANTMIRKGSLGLRHENPADIQRKILDELTVYGGVVINLTRNGVAENTSIGMEVSVPSEKFARFVVAVSAFGEVISQSESAQDAVGEIVDNEAALAEAKDYLKRLDTLAEKAPANLSEAQNLETERRRARYDIERYTRALDKLKERTSMATLNVSISTKRPETVVTPPSAFQKAFADGLEGLMRFTAFLMQVLLVTLPLSIPLTIFLVMLRRRRNRVPYGQ